MHYQDERTHGCRISDAWTYRGLKTVVLENEQLRVLVLADKGADIYSLVHKPTDIDFMWRSPWGVRDPRKFIPTSGSGASLWLDMYEGGWQTVLPHAGYPAAPVAGAEYGLHGEISTIPWDVQILLDTPDRVSARFWVRGVRSPFFVEKTLSIDAGSPKITVDLSVTNEGEEPAHCAWLEHIEFGYPFIQPGSRVYLPDCKVIVHPEALGETSKLKPGWEGPWPIAEARNGGQVDLTRIPGKDDRSHDLVYMSEMAEGWYAIVNENIGIGVAVSYPVEIFKYLWHWRPFGGAYGSPFYGRTYNAGFEPCTSIGNLGLQQAIDNKSSLYFEAGSSASARITASAIPGTESITRVRPDGTVERE